MVRERFIRVPKDEKALEVVNQLIESNSNEELVELKKMLDLAVTYKTIVGFDF